MHEKDRMKPITVRNLPKELARLVRRRAAAERISLNRALISLLDERLGASAREREVLHHHLDDLAGSWTPKEARRFERELAAQRAIEPELWK